MNFGGRRHRSAHGALLDTTSTATVGFRSISRSPSTGLDLHGKKTARPPWAEPSLRFPNVEIGSDWNWPRSTLDAFER